jgi:hypothetical protein
MSFQNFLELSESLKGIKSSTAYWDKNDLDGAIKAIKDALKDFGIYAISSPSEDDKTGGIILTDKPINADVAKQVEGHL